MKMRQEVAGPYYPKGNRAFLYCMIGDEALMFKPKDRLNAYQRQHVDSMRFDILAFSMCFVAISRPQDSIYLDRLFLEEKEFFDWHRDIYAKAGLRSSKRLFFHEPDHIYSEALKARREDELISTVCFSHQLQGACTMSRRLAVSKRVNSKVQLVARAATAGFRTPKSVLLAKRQLTRAALRRHFDFPKRGLFLKTDGVGGGFNVKSVNGFEECQAFARDFEPGTLFVAQEKVDRSIYSEGIVDYAVRSNGIEILSARLKLVANNSWFGGVYSSRLAFTESQIRNLERCIRDVQAQGYHCEEGFICGLDFFQSKDDQLITDINARWTGGLPVAILLDKLGLAGTTAYSHLDELSQSEILKYRRFVQKHLYTPGGDFKPAEGAFRIFPVSFSPKVNDGKLYVWFAVIGDYHAFALEKNLRFSPGSLPLSDTVDKLAIEKRALIEGLR